MNISMTIDEICKICNGKKSNVKDDGILVEPLRICSDTRKAAAGDTFIALKGERYDANDFVAEAFEKGALLAITEHSVHEYPCIIVDNTLRAIMQIAAHHRSKFDIPLVGITGSVGKTTTKEMTALALSSKYRTFRTEENRNNEVGMPFELLKLRPEHEAAVIEMGMSHFCEIERLSKGCRPNIAIITNIGWSHAENLGDTKEGVLKAKLEILNGMEANAPLIINGDDELLFPLSESITDREVIFCGMHNRKCTYYADNIAVENGSVSFNVIHNGTDESRIALPCIGEHHIIDALLAYAAAVKAGCNGKDICEKLTGFGLDGLRQHTEYRNGQTVIIDCYNAAPDSMKAALNVLCDTYPAENGKRVAVLGDMLELGSNSAELHREVGKYAAEKKVDLIICYGKQAEYIAQTAAEYGIRCYYSSDLNSIVDYLRANVNVGDVVLFKGSRGMNMEKIIKSYYN